MIVAYRFVDPRGLRSRQARLADTGDDLTSIRDRASGALKASGVSHELGVLAPLEQAVGFAATWVERINGYLADAELGANWRRFERFFVPGYGGAEDFREFLYQQAVLGVIEAMRRGQSPEEAEIAPSLFPTDYLDALEATDRLRAAAAEIAVEMYMSGTASGLAAELQRLLDEAESMAPSVGYDDIRRFIYETDALTTTDARHAVFAQVLVGDLEESYGAPWFDSAGDTLTAVAEALEQGSPSFGAAFFERFGPERTALIPMHAKYAENPAVLDAVQDALARASHLLPSTYGAAVLVAYEEYWYRPLDPDPYADLWPGSTPLRFTMKTFEPPAYVLFEGGQFDFDFIAAAYDQVEAQHDDYTFVAYTPEGEWYPDPRALLLQLVVDHPRFEPVEFLTAPRVDELITSEYWDDGYAAMSALAQLGEADPTDPAVRARIGEVARQIGAAGGTLQALTAVGAAAMVHEHLVMFVPNAFYDESTGRLERPVTPQWGRFDLPRAGYGNDGPEFDDTDLVRFLEVVMRTEAAQAVLIDSLAGTVDATIRQHGADPGRVADELAWLTGRFLDVSSGLALQQGRRQDEINDLTRRILGHTIGIGAGVLTGAAAPGLGFLAKTVLTVTRSELSRWSLKQLFPTNNEELAGADWRHQIVDPDVRRDFRAKVLSALIAETPGIFDPDKFPSLLMVDGRLPPAGHSYAFCPTADFWDEWWDTQPFITREIADSVDRLEAAFVGERALMSAPSINGPDLPFSSP